MGVQIDNNSHESGFFVHRSAFADINIIPLVDVVLVLLIIFMVTAPLAISGVNIQLPQTQAKPVSLSNDPIIISVAQNGDFFLGKEKVLLQELIQKLRLASQGNEKDTVIYIRADKSVPYGKVMEAMAAAQAAGIHKISMLGESSKPSK